VEPFMDVVNISISGNKNSGKTLIARAVVQILEEHGISVALNDVVKKDVSEDWEFHKEKIHDCMVVPILQRLDMQVSIEEVTI